MGNELRGDDGFGCLLIDNLKKHFTNSYLKKKNIVLINGSFAPENFIGLIIKENPSHILIVDAVLLNEQSKIKKNINNKLSGTILNINKDEISKYNSSTHSMSLSFLIKYLSNNITFKTFILGVEVEFMELGTDLTDNVENSLNKLQSIIIKTLDNLK
ncbi:MAG: hydrogenase 3 maturation endopeptidase HyCI [Methanobrevibacter sp.]|nr:hydrogenase 3 maturation endopeptidase HyCI [Methanobrevibacter sp.]